MARRGLALFVFSLLSATVLFAQSIPFSTLTGRVTAGDEGMPGVTVTVSSPNLQGTRTAVTSDGGNYIFPLLPPGEYRVQYELSGMQTVTRTITLTAASNDRLDVSLQQASVSAAITVTAETPVTAVIESSQVSTNFKQELIEDLPVQRNLTSITLLAPGVNSNGPSSGIVISGAMSFDSVFMVNGAIVNENLRGQPHSLFIEDAIQETTVITGGVPAEYGHFTGGVISAITKSGGNDFTGSLRSNLSNESWTEPTRFTADQDETIIPVYEGTLGGPILRDRLWFFGAGRSAKTEEIRQTVPGLARAGDQDANGVAIPVGTPLTPLTYPRTTDELRLEGKLTGTFAQRHTLVGSYLSIDASETNQTAQSIMDLDSLVPSRKTPNTFLVANYNGVLTDHFFVEGQYSKKDYAFRGSGSPYYDIIKGTLITDRARGTRYWSPTFRNTPEGEERDIEVYTAKATYFLTTQRTGSHEFRIGYEDFNEVRAVNNYQNGSDYRISAPNTIVRGTTVYPRFPGGATGTLTRISWLPIFVLSQGTDYTTRSVYLQDRWDLNDHWSFNLGARYDKNDAIGGNGSLQLADDSAVSPRLSAHYDLFGNGRIIFNTSYSHYVGRLAEGAANDVDPAGRNASLQWDYRGPSINNDVNVPTNQLVPTDVAIKMVMDWFFANGGTSRRPFRTTPSVPGVESVLDLEGLRSPMVKEMTLGVGGAIGSRGYARADLILRNWDNFYTSYRDLSNGKVSDQFGTQYDLSYIRSDNGVYDRDYTGVQTQFRYRVLNHLNVGGSYTWSRLTGNVTGETTDGPVVGVAAEYPEYRRAEWNFPTGYLTADQRHRARVYATYEIPTGFGDFDLSLLQSFDSGGRSSVVGSVDPRPYVTNPGYLTPPASIDYFFGGRGTIKSDDITRTDLGLNYSVRLTRGVQLFVRPQIINVFNEQGVESFDSEVLTAVDLPTTFKAFNPFTEIPKECPQGAAAADCQAMGANFQRGAGFGEPNSEGDFQQARTFRFSVGLRF